MKLTKKHKGIVREVADAHQQYLDVDAKRSSAGEAYINAFGPDTRHTFRLPSGRQIEVYVPTCELFYPEVTILESEEVIEA